ncbi:MAG: aspartate/glutamate racemase family protein [Fimbriimonadales bacterium]
MSKTIGLVGGTSPYSTSEYYLDIVRMHQAAFGDSSFPRMVIASVSFQQIVDRQHTGDWDGIAALLQREFDALDAAGADIVALTANTLHRVLPQLKSSREIVTVHEAVALDAQARGFVQIGLTGTRFTMNDPLYREALEGFGLTVTLPNESQQETIHRIIFENLVRGIATEDDGRDFEAICLDLLAQGTDAVLLGCTELKLLPLTAWTTERTIDSAHSHAKLLWERATLTES